MTTALMLAKLALAASERGDLSGARELLTAVIAVTAAQVDIAPTAALELRAVKKKTLARLLECTTRHVDALERRGSIPREAVLGQGAGKRYVLAAIFAALGRAAPVVAVDPVVEEGRAHALRKAKLKLVGGTG